MYYKRLIDRHLENWKHDPYRKPLLLRGARQVGKSTAVRHLGQTFTHFVEINFEQSPQLRTLFSGEISPSFLLERLSVTLGQRIIPGTTLVFFDEIQACPEAISSLRFFYEQMPELHVVAAGSLLEFALQSLPSYGVGRIKSCYMYPFSFDEFLAATGSELLLEYKKKASADQPFPESIHQKLLDQLLLFTVTGGMPEAVARYAETNDLLQVQQVLDDIISALRNDFAKYKNRVPALRLQEVFKAVVQQAGGKFVYAKAAEHIKDYQVKEALELLVLSGWVIPVVHTDANGIPLGAQANLKKRKMILLDTGIFQRILGLDLAGMFIEPNFVFTNKGVLAEHLWALEYIKYQTPYQPCDLYYWHREGKTNAEVDYVVQRKGHIYPVEIKSSGRGRMQSMRVFLAEKKYRYGYRFSQENFGLLDDVKIWPLYAVSNFVQEVTENEWAS